MDKSQVKIGSAAWYADKLVDWVALVTQLDPENDELPNVEDWRRNAEKLFEQAMSDASKQEKRRPAGAGRGGA